MMNKNISDAVFRFARCGARHSSASGAAAFLAAAGAALMFAAPAARAQSAAPKWDPYIDIEAKPGSQRDIGKADLFLPLVQDERTLLFANARGLIADHDDLEGNFGLGLRRMLQGGWNVGGYGYYDRSRSENDNTFTQATLGAEALGPEWDVRANLYLPQGDRAKSVSPIGGGTSTAAVVGDTVEVTTAGATLREEHALAGYDAEIGGRLPFYDADSPRQLRFYVGGYSFSDSVVKLSGPRARLEYTVAQVSGLWKGAQLIAGAEFQNDNVRGGQQFLSLRLRIPLGGSKESARLTVQEQRMTAPVVRDVDIVTQTRAAGTLPDLVETATVTAAGQPFTVISSVTTTGAALPGAVAAAGANSTVILSGTFNTTAAVALQPGQTLAGAIAVRTPSGHTATTPSATIDAVVAGPAVTPTNNSTFTGMALVNTTTGAAGAVGVEVNGATGVTISSNAISASSDSNNSIGVNIVGASSATVTGNQISASSLTGFGNALVLNGAGSVATVSGNTLNASGGGGANAVAAAAGTFDTAASTGNVLGSGACLSAGGTTGQVSFTNGTTCP